MPSYGSGGVGLPCSLAHIHSWSWVLALSKGPAAYKPPGENNLRSSRGRCTGWGCPFPALLGTSPTALVLSHIPSGHSPCVQAKLVDKFFSFALGWFSSLRLQSNTDCAFLLLSFSPWEDRNPGQPTLSFITVAPHSIAPFLLFATTQSFTQSKTPQLINTCSWIGVVG